MPERNTLTGEDEIDRHGSLGPTLNALLRVTGSTVPIGGTRLSCIPARRATSVGFQAECVGIDQLGAHVTAWAALSARALEPNVFLDPAFALPLFRHDSRSRGCRFLLVWDREPGASARLVGLFPLVLPRWPGGIGRLVLNEQTGCGTPLVDKTHAAAVIDVALSWLADGSRRQTALAISGVESNGPFAAELRRACAVSSRSSVKLATYSRAVLLRSQSDMGHVMSTASARRRQQYARQARRLARFGDRTFRSATTPGDVAAATEQFLELEQAGWKGARGTALQSSPGLASFARAMTREMAHEGRCRIDSLEIDGRPVAMTIVLTDHGRAYLWKTAFDETYAPCSPGVQLTLELTRRQLADPGVDLTDSCSAPDNPLLDRLWPDRVEMADLIVSVGPGGGIAFPLILSVERGRRALRQAVKNGWLGARRLCLRLKRSRRPPISS